MLCRGAYGVLDNILGNQNRMQDRPLLQQMKTPEFILFCFYLPIFSLWANFYFGSVEDRISPFADAETSKEPFFFPFDNLAKFLVEIYSIILPSSIVVSPLIAKSINSWGYVPSFWIVHFLGLLWSCLIIVENAYLQICSFCVFSIFRAFCYSVSM